MTFLQVLMTELTKLRRSKITWLSWLAFSIMPLVGGLFMWILSDPRRAAQLGLVGQKAMFLGVTASWQAYFGLLLQSVGMAGMLLVSVIAAYVFGREYADGTAKNMLALPVARHWFVVAKFAVVLVWFAALIVSVLAEGLAVGWLLGLKGFSAQLAISSCRNILLAALVSWLLVPVVAWIATLGRGYLAPLGFTIFAVVLGNVFSVTGWGKWFPWAIVPKFAGMAGFRTTSIEAGSFVVLAVVFLAGAAATILQMSCDDNS